MAAALAAAASTAAASLSQPITGAQPSFAAAIASTPGAGAEVGERPRGLARVGELEQQLEAHAGGRVRAGAERLTRDR